MNYVIIYVIYVISSLQIQSSLLYNLCNMKKVFLIGGALLSISLASCRKDYVCRCNKTYTSGTGTNIDNYALYPYNDTKRKAEDRCNTNNLNSSDFDGGYSIDCEIE